MVLLYEHWLVTETTLMALEDMVMSVRGAPTTAAAAGPTDTSLSNTTTGNRGENMLRPSTCLEQILSRAPHAFTFWTALSRVGGACGFVVF